MSEVLNIEEACQLLRVGKVTLYRYIRRGEIPAFKIGRNWKFHREALIEWMKEQIQANSQNRHVNHSIEIVSSDKT
jgi:excisionase family DNA binding protein